MSRMDARLSSERKPLAVFISYAHADAGFRDDLEAHPAFLKRSGGLKTWHDRAIDPGKEWGSEVEENLNSADIILLLISADFANSQYCWDVETRLALERYERGEALVIPIIIRPVDPGWKKTPLGKLQSLPEDARPVTMWPSRDEAYANIAAGLRNLVENWSRATAFAETERVSWSLKLEGNAEEYPEQRIQSIVTQLWKAANSFSLHFLAKSHGSVVLQFESPENVFNTLKELQDAGELQEKLSFPILDLSKDPGAVLRIEARVVNDEYQSTIRYLPDVFGLRPLEEGFPPLVGGISFPLDNPLQIGFSLLSDASLSMPTPDEQLELQTRLGRYLNTMLVLTGENLHADLSPLHEFCGLPELLRHTELGRDMLAQDVVLKHAIACHIHPSTLHGREFWAAADTFGAANAGAFESCFRVWIVPDDATVREKSENGRGHVTIEKLGLKVMCEEDYNTLRQLRRGTIATDASRVGRRAFELFRKHIVPEIQNEVSVGPRFGLLRQILSVLVISKWVRESELGGFLKQAVFLDSNKPEKYGLSSVQDDVLLSLKQVYLKMFKEGVWHYTLTHIDAESNVAEKRVYLAGGIALTRI
jgi:TIR domain